MTTFENNLKSILQDLEINKSFSRESLYEDCINKKLKNIVTEFDKDVQLTTDYLLRRASNKVLKSLTKLQKEKDKEILNTYLKD